MILKTSRSRAPAKKRASEGAKYISQARDRIKLDATLLLFAIGRLLKNTLVFFGGVVIQFPGRPKRLAYLNSHSSAAAFVADMCRRNDVEIYIPRKCPEVGSITEADAMHARYVSIPTWAIEILDCADLYSVEHVGDDLIKVLNRHFDAIIIPGAARQPAFREIASRTKIKIIILEWGDVGGVIFHPEWSTVRRRPNIEIAVAYRWFSERLRHLPLGLNRAVYAIPKRDKFAEPTFLISALPSLEKRLQHRYVDQGFI